MYILQLSNYVHELQTEQNYKFEFKMIYHAIFSELSFPPIRYPWIIIFSWSSKAGFLRKSIKSNKGCVRNLDLRVL